MLHRGRISQIDWKLVYLPVRKCLLGMLLTFSCTLRSSGHSCRNQCLIACWCAIPFGISRWRGRSIHCRQLKKNLHLIFRWMPHLHLLQPHLRTELWNTISYMILLVSWCPMERFQSKSNHSSNNLFLHLWTKRSNQTDDTSTHWKIVNKTSNMEHSGTSQNILKHFGT